MESEKKGTASAELLDFAGPGPDTFAFDKPLPPEPSASDLLDDFLKAEAGDFGFKNAVEPEKSSGKVDVDKDFGGFEETDDFDKFDSPKKSDFGKIDISKDFDDFMEDSRSGGVGESPPLTPRPDYDFMAREASPLPREPMPLPKDPTPPPKQPTPSPPRQPSPAKEPTPPPPKEPTPPPKEPTPPPKEPTPSPKEPTPPPKEPTPPPKEPTPPPKEPTPPPKEPTPPPKEPTPPPKEPTPPPKEPTPPPKEPTPPPKEPTPPPKEPTPPPREPTPTPKEPTPPPKTPTPPREPSPPLREPTPPREPSPTPPPSPVVKDPSPVKEFIKSSPVRERPASVSDIAPKDLFANIGLDAWFNPGRLHPKVESLVYWRDVKKSGVVFGVTLACLLSLVYCSLISVVSYLCLFTLFATVSFRIYKNVMQAVQKTSDGHPFKDLLEVDLEIKEDKAKEACSAVISHVNSWLTELRRLFLVVDLVDSLKFGVCLWALTYVGALFNGLSLIILCWIALFSLPKVYENNKQQIDASMELANSKISEITNKVKAALPGKKEEKKDQ